ncbi:RNA-dependent RNA polymerase [Wenling narna-like virus 2]|uniref:RNA-dependent RNA polymerase n=1 Tax=Wenling narna-like virus 2 TaxID=1923502 RepID=UPI00090A0896|nr:RNA-dependent RNA polymerase [Wenling narna-like virus 2]APG77261.1 RNA-dependent RNA polymerase [Wenling narna-like virus 2]
MSPRNLFPSYGDGCSSVNSTENTLASILESPFHPAWSAVVEGFFGNEVVTDTHVDELAIYEDGLDLSAYSTSSVEQVVRCCEVYSFIYDQYGYKFLFSPTDQRLWLELGDKDLLEVYLKWITANILAAVWEQDELVPLPSSLLDFSARFPAFGLTTRDDRLFRSMIRSSRRSKKQQRFVYTLYQGKAGCNAMRPELVAAKVVSAVETLATPPEGEESIGILGHLITKEDIRGQLLRTVTEIYGTGHARERRTPGSRRMASSKSSFQYTRSKGGAHEFLVDNAPASMFIQPRILSGFVVYKTQVRPYYTTFQAEDWEELQELSRRAAWSEEMDCYPVGLPEAFKVRVITKGAVHHYNLARRWQPAMWEPLANHPTFELVGTPNCQRIMNRFLAKCDPDDDRAFTSGDYASATDYLDSDLSRSCLEYVCNALRVPFEDTVILAEALTDHRLHYVDSEGVEQVKQQRRGQLMGSPISFPILCLFNAALTRYALEIASCDSVALDLEDLPMLINGDDLLCRTNPLEYLVWKDIVNFGGLTPSIGKNFRHRTIGTINSEMWTFKHTIHGCPANGTDTAFYQGKRQPIIEIGLVRGSVKRGTINRNVDELSPFVDSSKFGKSKEQCWNRFLDTCPNRLTAYDFLWRSVSSDILESLPRGMPMCCPTWLGGAGFPLPPLGHALRDRREPSAYQRLLARYLYDTYGYGLGKRYVSMLETGSLPANLVKEMNTDNGIRDVLGVPKPVPESADSVDGIKGNLHSEKTPLTPLPQTHFFMCGLINHTEEESTGRFSCEKMYSRLQHKALKHGRGPLDCKFFLPTPPSLKLESYVFQEVVA